MNTNFQSQIASDPALVKLFVGGIQPTCKESDIRQALSDYGAHIAKVDIKMKNGFLNRGYAFIFVSNQAIANKMTKMKFKLGDRILQIQTINKNKKEKEEYKQKRLYLKNLPPNTSDRELHQFFERFGEVRSSYIIKDRFGDYRDYGFIDFEDIDDVDKCLEELKKAPLIMRGNKIKVRRFIKLEDKNDNENDDDSNELDPLHDGEVEESVQAQTQFNITPQDAQRLVPNQFPLYSPMQFTSPLRQNIAATQSQTGLPYLFRPLGTPQLMARRGGYHTRSPPTAITSPAIGLGECVVELGLDDSFVNPGSNPESCNVADKPAKYFLDQEEFEVDNDFIVQRDYLSYQSDVDLNHCTENLRLNLGFSIRQFRPELFK